MTDTLTKTLRSSFLIIAFSLLLSFNAKAQTCGTPPSCDSLGYTLKSSTCTGKTMLKCPFDTTKVYCDGVVCDNSFKFTCTGSYEYGSGAPCDSKYKTCGCAVGYTWKNDSCCPNSCPFPKYDSGCYCSTCGDRNSYTCPSGYRPIEDCACYEDSWNNDPKNRVNGTWKSVCYAMTTQPICIKNPGEAGDRVPGCI